jgi:hypothetical protein
VPTPVRRVRLRTIAFPVEHGGWGFLLEPIVLGLVAAPSAGGLCLARGVVAAFLARHPLKLFLKHRQEASRSKRTALAARVAAAYLLIALGAAAAVVRLTGPMPFVPFLLLSPFIIGFLVYDTRNRGRDVLAELSGPLGLAATGPALALAGGWNWQQAAAMWVILMARTVPSIFYVRSRLRLERRTQAGVAGVIVWHIVFLACVVAFLRVALAPVLAVVALLVLFGRAMIGLSPLRRPARARRIGFSEIGYGLFYAAAVAIGYRVGW